MSVALAVVWLLVAGPAAGLALARATGPLTGARAAAWAVGCQLALVALYLATQAVPVRSFTGRAPTRAEAWRAKAAAAAALALLAAGVAGLAAAVWRRLAGA